MHQLSLFDVRQRKCAFCGVSFVPFSIDAFKIAFRIDMAHTTPELRAELSKFGYAENTRFCGVEHMDAYRTREEERIVWEAMQKLTRKPR